MRPLFSAMSFSTLLPLHSCDVCKWLNTLFRELLSLFKSDLVRLWWLSLSWWSPTRVEAICEAYALWITIAALLDEKPCVVCFCCPFLCLLRHLFLFLNSNVLYILFGFSFSRLASPPDVSPQSLFRSSPDALPPSLFSPKTSFPWPIASARASSGGSVSMAYRMAQSGEGCGDWRVQQSVRAVRYISCIASIDFTIAVCRPLRTVLTLMQAYRKE